jgi:hypothetical protein
MKAKYIYIIAILLVITFAMFMITNLENTENMENNNKIACFYSYYEKNEMYKNNFVYFLENAILDNVDYYIIINGEKSVPIPKKENIKVYQRENKGLDFGAYSYGLKQLTKSYDYYFFINTSVIGPVTKGDWTEPFIKLFNEDVKVVGTSINMYSYTDIYFNYEKLYNKPPPYSHVQSMFFCINKEYFDYLNTKNFFNEEELNDADMKYVVMNKEVGLSQLAINNGWNINCILSKYKDLDYRKLDKDINPTSMHHGDPYFEGAYFGGTIDKEEVIFYKNSRFE